MSAAGGPARTLRDATGSALLGVMMLTMMLAAITAAITLSGQTELLVARSDETSAQARAAAHSGLNHAVDITLAHLQAGGFGSAGLTFTELLEGGFTSASLTFTALLEGPDGVTGSAEADADNGSLELLGIPRPPATLPLNGIFAVSYEARVLDDDDPARGLTLSGADVARIGEDGEPFADANSGVVVRATGYGPAATSVTLEAFLGSQGLPALLVNGALSIGDHATVDGAAGSVHVNGDLSLTDSAEVSGDATSGGAYSESAQASVGGNAGGGYPAMTVPAVNAEDYRQTADFIMTAAGFVTDQNSNVLCDASTDGSACEDDYGWTFNGILGWEYSDKNHDGGAFYVETDAEISADLGSNQSAVPLTLAAEGSIRVSGRPFLTSSVGSVMFVTNEDLSIDGPGNFTIEGNVLVREQIHIDGNVSLTGQVTVEDVTSTSAVVAANVVDGHATITFGGGGAGGDVRLTAWREVR